MKSYAEPIQVQAVRGRPLSLRWRRSTCPVTAILDCWVLQTRWWEREEKRCYYLLTTSRGNMEVYRQQDNWVLSRLLD